MGRNWKVKGLRTRIKQDANVGRRLEQHLADPTEPLMRGYTGAIASLVIVGWLVVLAIAFLSARKRRPTVIKPSGDHVRLGGFDF
jgi:hypothetical protein